MLSEALGLLMQSTDGKQGTAGAGDVPARTTSPLTMWEQHLVGLGRQRVGEAQGRCAEVTGEVGAAEPGGGRESLAAGGARNALLPHNSPKCSEFGV